MMLGPLYIPDWTNILILMKCSFIVCVIDLIVTDRKTTAFRHGNNRYQLLQEDQKQRKYSFHGTSVLFVEFSSNWS